MSFNSPPSQEPLFFRNTDIDSENNPVTVLEVCNAMSRSVGARSVDGAQQIRGIWRLYTKSKESRVQLLVKGISIRGRRVELSETNPRNTKQDDPSAPVEKIVFKDIPLSVDNKQIMSYLKEHSHVQLTTDVRYSRERNEDGSLSNYRNGDRFVFALQPVVPPLKTKDNIGTFTARIFHHSQNLTCKACNLPGHRPKTDDCPAYDPGMNVLPFRSRFSKLSNFYPCDLQVPEYDIVFASVEHYFQWEKAICLGKTDVADQILDAPHAAAAKSIADSHLEKEVKKEDTKWNVDVAKRTMEKALEAKLECCPEFRQTLMDTGDAILAEATSDTFWGSGLLPKVVKTTKPDFWPGKNILGQMLMTLREEENKFQAFEKKRYNQWVNDIPSEEEGEFKDMNASQTNSSSHDDDVENELDDSKHFGDQDRGDREGFHYESPELEGYYANEYSYIEYPPLRRKPEDTTTATEAKEREQENKDGKKIEINDTLFDESCDFDNDDDIATQDPALTPSPMSEEHPTTSTQQNTQDKSENNEQETHVDKQKCGQKDHKGTESSLLQRKMDYFFSGQTKRATPDETSPDTQSAKYTKTDEGEVT